MCTHDKYEPLGFMSNRLFSKPLAAKRKVHVIRPNDSDVRSKDSVKGSVAIKRSAAKFDQCSDCLSYSHKPCLDIHNITMTSIPPNACVHTRSRTACALTSNLACVLCTLVKTHIPTPASHSLYNRKAIEKLDTIRDQFAVLSIPCISMLTPNKELDPCGSGNSPLPAHSQDPETTLSLVMIHGLHTVSILKLHMSTYT